MRRPSRKAAIAIVIVVTVFTAVVAFAAQLSLSSTSLQAGSAAVGKVCTGTIATSYTTGGVDVNGNALVSSVSLDPTAGACTNGTGYTVSIYLEQGTAGAYSALGTGMTATAVTIATANSFTAASGTGVTFTAPKLTFDFSGQNLAVSAMSNVSVVIA